MRVLDTPKNGLRHCSTPRWRKVAQGGAKTAAQLRHHPPPLGRGGGAVEHGLAEQVSGWRKTDKNTGAKVMIEIGDTLIREGQNYRCVEVLPYVRKDGTQSAVCVVVSACADCSKEFRFTIPARGARYLNRRCLGCKRPGVKAEARHAQP